MKYFLSKFIVLPTALLFTVFSITACFGGTTTTDAATVSDSVTTTTVDTSQYTELSASYSEKDLNAAWEDSTAVHITLADTAISSDKETGVSIDGTTVTISASGTYVLAGTLLDGQVIVDAGEKDDIQLVLNGITLTNSRTSPLYIKNADKTIITLPDGSVNSINDSANYTFLEGEDEPDAAVFSNNDLTINGSGKLIVNGNYRNGIATKDDLVIVSGTLEITAINDALRGRDSIAVKDGKLHLNAGGDGMKANQDADTTKGHIVLDGGDYNIIAENDGIQAETVLKINDGNYVITTGGGSGNAPARTDENNPAMGGGGRNGGMRPDMTKVTPPDMPSGTPPTRPDTASETGDTAPAKPDATSKASDAANEATSTTATETTEESIKGLKAGSALIINGGSFKLDTADDALHSNGSLTLNSGSFAITAGDDAIHSDTDLVINSGTLAISKSYEGLEGASVSINGGDINIVSTDDGINAAGGNDTSTGDSFRTTGEYWIRVTSGTIDIRSSGDGIDSNGDFYQTGGDIIIQSTQNPGDSALDYDGQCQITGGTISPAVTVDSDGFATKTNMHQGK